MRSLSRHLLAVDQGSSGATCLLPASVDSTWNPEKPCYFGSFFFTVQSQQFFMSVMLHRGILFCCIAYLNGRSFAGRYRHKPEVFSLPFLAKLDFICHLPFL